MRKLKAKRFVLDGEVAVPVAGRFSFNSLLQRIHPAASRVKNLAAETPAIFIAFDLLMTERGRSLLEMPLRERRPLLESFARRFFSASGELCLSPATTKLADAMKWFKAVGGDLDGIIAKRLDRPYRSGERDGMQKIKHHHTADCVVGGFRYGKGTRELGSLAAARLYDARAGLHAPRRLHIRLHGHQPSRVSEAAAAP